MDEDYFEMNTGDSSYISKASIFKMHNDLLYKSFNFIDRDQI